MWARHYWPFLGRQSLRDNLLAFIVSEISTFIRTARSLSKICIYYICIYQRI